MRKLKIIFVGLLLFLLSPLALAGSFYDVSTSHEHYSAIEYLEFMGIVEGYEDGSYKPAFMPDVTINRAEFTKIVIGAFFDEDEIEDCDNSYFTDTPSNQWYSPYICMAKEQEVLSGYSDGSFKPSNEINFVEAAKIISNH